MKETTTGSGWRNRWADRENESRRRAYDATVAAWQHRDDELRRLRATAAEFQGSAEAGVGLPVELLPGEVVYAVLSAAELVEAEGRHVAGLPRPDLAILPDPNVALAPVLPDGLETVDAGMAVVTDRAVVFLGRNGVREWPYAQLTGVAHDWAASFTLLHAVDEQRIFGLLMPPAAAPGFRFHVTLALAEAIGQRATVVAQLDEVIAAHQCAPPPAPVMVTWDQAPLTAFAPVGKVSAVATVAVALLVTAWAVALGNSDPPPTNPVTAIGVPPAAVASATAGGTTTIGPAAAAGGTADPGGPDVDAASAVPTAGAPVPTAPSALPAATTLDPRSSPAGKPRPTRTTAAPTPTPTPTTGNLCGAPPNPYGYNFCGGSYIREPAADVCDYFPCVADFWSGMGYMIQCGDGMVSMLGSREGPCVDHNGNWRAVYQ